MLSQNWFYQVASCTGIVQKHFSSLTKEAGMYPVDKQTGNTAPGYCKCQILSQAEECIEDNQTQGRV